MVMEEAGMNLAATSRVTILALAAFVSVTNGALAEPPDPCKTGCVTSRGHVTTYLNPQPLPPGVKGPGHGGGNFITLGHAGYAYGGGAGVGKIR
jgi:hypothetical protein